MPAEVYIETTVVSYLAARPSRDLIVAAHQQLTHEWWSTRRPQFNLVTSQFVLDESSAGDQQVARKRLELLAEIPLLEASDFVSEVAAKIVDSRALPKKASQDALHIAVATVHQVDYLLTWNCKHIANAEIQKTVSRICKEIELDLPTICTPEELMGE